MIAARRLKVAARSVLIFGAKLKMLGTAVKSPSFTGWRLAATRLMAVGLFPGSPRSENVNDGFHLQFLAND
ncbi:hypothetical protein SAMN05444158_0840 [Bradyrhizobium canariense]|uniref:Uncharacterized protein n=2 Tax=Bradyrhizobium canariense TaxID=255045 RepID=A0A1H1P187_9BRAD|nr:hypothetical protein SAMN05444158_0840 [Bradyrhizobium canariense]